MVGGKELRKQEMIRNELEAIVVKRSIQRTKVNLKELFYSS